MRIVVALGGNALLRRGEPLSAENQRRNVRVAAKALAELAVDHQIIVTHGNGPQVGLLALQALAYTEVAAYPLDILGAETEGMIGYVIEQELMNALPEGARCATLLTQIQVDGNDPAFASPSKPIGPVYGEEARSRLGDERGWSFVEEAAGQWRRTVPSPLPRAILQLDVLQQLVEAGVVVVCAGGGGIPVIRRADGQFEGVEAVIDKDRAAGLLAENLKADAFLMLTDVEAVFADWGGPDQHAISHADPDQLATMDFAAGSMGPKVTSACDFASRTGGMAGIGRLEDAARILVGEAGTTVRRR
ncbi:carbamate kinase [Marinobacter salicampi]|uniref:carbamate kinase n=1 Tax=Marinobacter salicampi TaxID=435907 RepID=UPI00140A022E|nr:carbamate kinase [Marinobacter salicampi]